MNKDVQNTIEKVRKAQKDNDFLMIISYFNWSKQNLQLCHDPICPFVAINLKIIRS